MPRSVFLVEPTRVEAGDQGISFGRRSNCDRRARLVLGSRAHGSVLKCGHVCPFRRMAESSAANFTVGQKDWRQRVAKMYGQQKRNIIHTSSTAYEQDHSAAAPLSSVMNSHRFIRSPRRRVSGSGTVRPRALAALRLMTSSTFVA